MDRKTYWKVMKWSNLFVEGMGDSTVKSGEIKILLDNSVFLWKNTTLTSLKDLHCIVKYLLRLQCLFKVVCTVLWHRYILYLAVVIYQVCAYNDYTCICTRNFYPKLNVNTCRLWENVTDRFSNVNTYTFAV